MAAKHKALAKFVKSHYANPQNIRLGQRFCNMYIKGQWPELFYCNDAKAKILIGQWLVDNQYFDQLPPELKEIK